MTSQFGFWSWHRLAVLAAGICAVWAAYARTEPAVAVAQARLRAAELTLRSDEVAFAEAPRLREEVRRLHLNLDKEFRANPEARALEAIAIITRRHHLEFDSTQSVTNTDSRREALGDFEDVRLTLELKGAYRDALAAIDELTRECRIVRVESATLHRSGDTLALDLAIAILRWNQTVTPRESAEAPV